MKHQDAAADDGDKEEEEEETTVSGATDSSRGGIRQLPDFGQSPVNSFAGSSTVGPTVGQHAGTHFSGLFSSGHCNPTVICLRCIVNSGLQGATFFFLEP